SAGRAATTGRTGAVFNLQPPGCRGSLFFVHAIICKGDLLFCMLVQYNNFQTYKSDYSENMFKTLQSS
ncbi:hypothetical protein, partial [Escherichia coli]|uniref:hypothetical protein n=1 Tax=Escherichia coli TaxID=562 RepID=UPI001BC89B50